MNLYDAILAESISGGGTQPTGEIEITENGEYDVSEYATANVNVETSPADSWLNVQGNSSSLNFDMTYEYNGEMLYGTQGGRSQPFPVHTMAQTLIIVKPINYGQKAVITSSTNLSDGIYCEEMAGNYKRGIWIVSILDPGEAYIQATVENL